MRLKPASSSALCALLLSVTLALGGCISSDREPVLVRPAPVDFYESFEQMTFKVLPPNEQVRLAINDSDPRFGVEKGVSHYEALALPDLAHPYILRIDSEVVKTDVYRNGTIFFPVLTFQDADKRWIRTFDSLPYVTQKPYDGRNYITVSIQISDELAAARYLVVHTQQDKFNKAIGRDDGQVLMQSKDFNTMLVPLHTEPRYRYEFAPAGWVRLKASPPSNKEPGKVQSVSNFY